MCDMNVEKVSGDLLCKRYVGGASEQIYMLKLLID